MKKVGWILFFAALILIVWIILSIKPGNLQQQNIEQDAHFPGQPDSTLPEETAQLPIPEEGTCNFDRDFSCQDFWVLGGEGISKISFELVNIGESSFDIEKVTVEGCGEANPSIALWPSETRLIGVACQDLIRGEIFDAEIEIMYYVSGQEERITKGNITKIII